MVMKAIQQFIDDTLWKDIDVLIIDLPPGTGDAQLTLVQNVYVDGALIVTTPEKMAVEDARRAYNMFLKVDVPVLGLVENMSFFSCPQCGHQEKIFNSAEFDRFTTETGLEVLGKIPVTGFLSSERPSVITLEDPGNEISRIFHEVADKIREKLKL